MVATGAVMAVVAACGGSTDPDSGLGEWELTLVDGQALPTVYQIYGICGCANRRALSGSLTFTGETRVVDARRLSNQPGGSLPDEFDYVNTTSYRLEGDVVVINRPGIPGAGLAAHADTGYVVDGEVLVIPVRTVEGEVALRRTLSYVKR